MTHSLTGAPETNSSTTFPRVPPTTVFDESSDSLLLSSPFDCWFASSRVCRYLVSSDFTSSGDNFFAIANVMEENGGDETVDDGHFDWKLRQYLVIAVPDWNASTTPTYVQLHGLQRIFRTAMPTEAVMQKKNILPCFVMFK